MNPMKIKLIFWGLCCILGISAQSNQTNANEHFPSVSYWDVDYSSGWKMQFTLTVDGDRFTLKNRKNSAKEALGGFNYRAAKMIGKLKSSEIVEISGKISYNGDTAVLQGQYYSPVNRHDFNARIIDGQFRGKLKNGLQMNGIQVSQLLPRRNYVSLVDSIYTLTNRYIYDPKQLETKEYIEFKKRIDRIGQVAHDDCEFEYLFYWYSSRLPFSHYFVHLYKTDSSSSSSSETPQYVTLSEINESCGLLTVNSFGGKKSEMDSIVRILQEKPYQNLVIDLRKNPGGGIGPALTLGEYLVSDTLYFGLFLTRNYFDKHQQLPTIDEYRSFPQLSEANETKLLMNMHEYEGVCLKATPGKNPFKGKIFVLTSSLTASACEPFVYGLKYNHLATIVGEKTAGQMLSMEPFSIIDNECTLYLPTSDYYTVDGRHLDRIGVEPNIKVAQDKALDYVKQLLIKQDPNK